MNRNRVAAIAASAAALLLLGAMASHIFELREVKVERSVGRAAARDPWLALDRALSESSEVRRYSSLGEIDFSSAGLIIAGGKELAVYDAKPNGLAKWVSDGGRLVIAWPGYLGDSDKIALRSFPELVPRKSKEVSAIARAKGNYLGKAVDIEASGGIYFERAKERSGYLGLSDGKTIRVAMVCSGKGWALAGARPFFLENRRLADPGNRAFAADLFGKDAAGAVWLPAPSRDDPAAKPDGLAVRTAFLPIVGTALLLCLALLWSRAPRFGPALPESLADRQSILERFRAEGRFLFDRGAGNEILRRIGAAPAPGKAARGRRGGKAIMKAVEERVLREAEKKEGRER
jgi:hypothetical protein